MQSRVARAPKSRDGSAGSFRSVKRLNLMQFSLNVTQHSLQGGGSARSDVAECEEGQWVDLQRIRESPHLRERWALQVSFQRAYIGSARDRCEVFLRLRTRLPYVAERTSEVGFTGHGIT